MYKSPHYDYCCRTVAAATALFRDVQQQSPPSLQAIRLRRRKDEVICRARFDELRRAFLTPIDRDDLFLLCIIVNRALYCAEEVVLEWERQRMPHLQELWEYLSSICSQLEQTVISFTDTHNNEAVINNAYKLRQTFFDRPSPPVSSLPLYRLYDSASVFIESCRDVADVLLLTVLRNE